MSAAPSVFFHEDQRFRGSILWILTAILVCAGVLVAATAVPRGSFVGLVTVAILAAVFLLFLFARLETEVRGDAVYVHFHGLWPTRRIRLEDIAGFQARRYTM